MALHITIEEEYTHTIILDLYGFEKDIHVSASRFREACIIEELHYPIPYLLLCFVEDASITSMRYIIFNISAGKKLRYGRKAQRFLVKEFVRKY